MLSEIAKEGEIIAIDIRPLRFRAKNVRFIRSRIEDLDIESLGKFDVVLSDLSPNLSGHYSLDQARQLMLTLKAYEIAQKALRFDGSFIAKLFYGEGVEDLLEDARKRFKFAKLFKPKASRSRSSEIYLIAVGFGKSRKV